MIGFVLLAENAFICARGSMSYRVAEKDTSTAQQGECLTLRVWVVSDVLI